MSDLEVAQYQVPAWDCPNCGEVNTMFGQDDAVGPQQCPECDTPVVVTE